MKESRKIETITLVTGLVLTIGSLFLGRMMFSLGVLLGAIFSSINFRLLVWSWGAVFQRIDETEAPDASGVSVLPRFVLKYSFMFLGILLIVVGLRAEPIGFCLGISNVFFAILLYSILPKKAE